MTKVTQTAEKEVKVVIKKRHKFYYAVGLFLLFVVLQSIYANYSPVWMRISYLSLEVDTAIKGQPLVMRSTAIKGASFKVYGIDQLRGGFSPNPDDMFFINGFEQKTSWLVRTGYSSGKWVFLDEDRPERGLPARFDYYQVKSLVCANSDYTNCITVVSKPFKAIPEDAE